TTATMMMRRLSAMPRRLQPMRRSKKCAAPRRVFSISGPAVGASIDRFSETAPLADVVCRREGGEWRVDWPHPAMFSRSLLLSPQAMSRRRTIVYQHRPRAHISQGIAMTDHPVARRAVIKSAGLSIGAAFASGIVPARAQAPAQAAPAEIWSHEYWAQKGEVKLNLWRKRLGAPKPGESPLPVLFLVHGSSLSARSSYDLGAPGNGP